jgi:AcrR family transcriptional regulator
MRRRLCDAALGVIREKGIEAATFRTLADAAAVSHTLPYRYFENKDALLAGVRVQCFGFFETYVRKRELTTAPALDRVLSLVDAYVSFVLEHPVEYALIFATPQPTPVRFPDLLAARKRLFDHAVALVQHCVTAGNVRGDARKITHAVWASLHGLLSLHVANQLVHGYDLEALVWPTIYRLLGVPSSTVAPARWRLVNRPAKIRRSRPLVVVGKRG